MTAPPIPLDALEAAHWLIVGTTGSGKTYLARGLFEQLRRAGRRLGAIDKLGKLWGLTVSADGAAAGLEFVIFGGKRPGAVPMRPGDGHRIGGLFVERNIPAIFDLSQWEADDQEAWVADFSLAVFATNAAALHLLFDEAQSWVPANGGGAAYKAVRLLAEQGRGNGINLLLTAPRLSRIDASVREAMAALVAMRQTGTVDRAKTVELVAGHLAIDEKAFRNDLSSLPTGTGFVWSPTGSGLERVAFPPNATFDSSRTPRHGDAPPPPIAVSSALVDELRAALAPPAETHPDDAIPVDPTAAYARGSEVGTLLVERDARIAELERRLTEAEQSSEHWHDYAARQQAQLKAYHGIFTELENLIAQSRRGLTERQLRDGRSNLHHDDADPHDQDALAAGEPKPPEAGRAAGGVTSFSPPAAKPPTALTPSARALLMTIAMLTPRRLTLEQAALLSGLSRRSSTFAQNRKLLLDDGWLSIEDGYATLLPRALDDAEIAAARGAQGGDPLEMWASRFTPGVGRLLRVVAEKYRRSKRPIGRVELAFSAELSVTSSTFAGGLTELRRNGLIEAVQGGFLLGEALR